MVRPRQISDEDILTKARSCFLEHGPGLATGVIAKELGVSQATLFNRFGTKEELFRAALNLPHANWAEGLADGPTQAPIEAQLQDIGLAILTYLDQLMPTIVVLRASGIAPRDCAEPDLEPPPIRHHRTLSSWFERAHQRGLLAVPSPETAAQTFMGTLHARAMMRHLWGKPMVPVSDSEYVQQFVGTLLVGLKSHSEESK